LLLHRAGVDLGFRFHAIRLPPANGFDEAIELIAREADATADGRIGLGLVEREINRASAHTDSSDGVDAEGAQSRRAHTPVL
jgi:hypothetical protein